MKTVMKCLLITLSTVCLAETGNERAPVPGEIDPRPATAPRPDWAPDPDESLFLQDVKGECYCGLFNGSCMVFRLGDDKSFRSIRSNRCEISDCKKNFASTLVNECRERWGRWAADYHRVEWNDGRKTWRIGSMATSYDDRHKACPLLYRPAGFADYLGVTADGGPKRDVREAIISSPLGKYLHDGDIVWGEGIVKAVTGQIGGESYNSNNAGRSSGSAGYYTGAITLYGVRVQTVRLGRLANPLEATWSNSLSSVFQYDKASTDLGIVLCVQP